MPGIRGDVERVNLRWPKRSAAQPAQKERCKGFLVVPAHLGNLVRIMLQKNKLPPRELRIPGIRMQEVRIPEIVSATGIKNST